jgi:hypothetical protein
MSETLESVATEVDQRQLAEQWIGLAWFPGFRQDRWSRAEFRWCR